MDYPDTIPEARAGSCPVCDKRATYFPAEDRYYHVDGSSNDPCWLVLLRDTDRVLTVSTWSRVNLDPILDGTYTPPTPTVGARDDEVGILYPGRDHAAYGESESGKSWFALLIAAHELAIGNAVVYLDFEDDPGAIVGRLLSLTTSISFDDDDIRKRFAYIHPSEPITVPGNGSVLDEALGDLKPTLGVVDGVTEAMTLHGLDLKDNIDIAKFNRAVPGRISASGAASLTLDHVAKNAEQRGRYAIGGQHKLAGLNGAGFLIENRRPFGVGVTGVSGIYVTKDRPAQLRKNAVRSGGDGSRYWFGDLTISPIAADLDEWLNGSITAPVKAEGPPRPTTLMHKVSEALGKAARPLSTRDILDRVPGKQAYVRQAIATLVDEGHIAVEDGPRGAHMHTLTRPYGGEE